MSTERRLALARRMVRSDAFRGPRRCCTLHARANPGLHRHDFDVRLDSVGPAVASCPKTRRTSRACLCLFRQNPRFNAEWARSTRRNSSIFRSIRGNGRGRPSSCRKRLRSNSRPGLALHEVLLLDVGPDGTITVVDKLLGHTNFETTARYAHLALDSLHETAERIAESIAANIL